MAEDEGDEEGDHGSIVAFRIPCSPSVDFQPPCPPAFYTPASPRGRLLQPADLHPLATRLLLSCPPFLSPILRALPLSRPRLSVPVIPWPPLSSALPPPSPLPPSTRPPLRRPMRLARNHQPSTAVAYLHRRRARVVTQAQTRRPDTIPSSLLALTFPRHVCASAFSISFIPPSSRFHPCASISLPHLHANLTFRLSVSLSLSLSLSFLTVCLPVSRRFPGEGEARAARSRSVA